MKSANYRTYNRRKLMPQGDKEAMPAVSTFAREGFAVLEEAHAAWDAIDAYRRQRVRNRNYTFGKQWGDTVLLPDGRTVTEEQYLREQGKVPLKNNMIRQLIKSVLGQFRSMQTEPVCVARDRREQELGELMSATMQYAYQHNRLYELDSRTLEEFLISGSCFHKIGYGYRRGKQDVWVDAIPPSRIFFNNMEDTRLWDCTLIGELHDMSLSDVIARFSAGDEAGAKRLAEIYGDVTEENLYHTYDTLTGERLDNLGFYMPVATDLCRVIEVWKLESRPRLRCHDILTGEYYKVDIDERSHIEQINRERKAAAAEQGVEEDNVPVIETEWFVDHFWYYRFLSPLGDILDEGESPYWHGEHPYALRLYPLLDGEIHSFVEDVIDQQRYINRLITMIDFIMGSSAKGVLLFPEDQIPDGMTLDDIASEWSRYNGVIPFRPKPGDTMPQQISVNATNVGAYELLSLQMRLLEDISGVHSAMQGKTVPGGTASSLYAQQIQYSATNLLDIFESFKIFREERDTKIMKTIQQFYDDERYIAIAGSSCGKDAGTYTPEEVRNTEFDLTIAESVKSPVYRQVSNDFLLALFNAGHISLQSLLETGAFPFADKLLQRLRVEAEEQLAAASAMSAMQPGEQPSVPPATQPAQQPVVLPTGV